MEKSQVLFFLGVYVLFLFGRLRGRLIVSAGGTKDGSEIWGYVEVRPKAHMFWWYHKNHQRTQNSSQPWPIILWLQGGPGASGVGVGNFQLIGPLNTYLKHRNSSWLKKADLLFVDNQVSVGFSFVKGKPLSVKTDEEAASDLTKLLIEVFNKNENLQKNNLYIVAESFGGKYAVTLGLSIFKAIKTEKLRVKLGGIALGDAWISPEDYVLSWGPLLKDISMRDENGLAATNRVAIQIKQQLMAGKVADAFDSWAELENVIYIHSNGLNFYNFLMDEWMGILEASSSAESSHQASSSSTMMMMMMMKRYSTFLSSLSGLDGNLTGLMNEEMRKKLKIIPQSLTLVISLISSTLFQRYLLFSLFLFLLMNGLVGVVCT